MTELTILSTINPEVLPLPKLVQLKRQLGEYFYKAGTNIAFYSIFNDKKTSLFRNRVIDTITRQILQLAKLEIFSHLFKQGTLTDKVTKEWLPFLDIFPDGTPTILAFYSWLAEEGEKSAFEKINSQLEFYPLNLQSELKARIKFMTQSVDKTGIDWVVKVVETGFKQKINNVQLVAYLRENAKRIASERGSLITETEVMTIMNMAELAVYTQEKVKKVSWQTVIDERRCNVCLNNERVGEITLGKNFPSGHKSPLAHPLCRCFLVPVI